MALEQTPYEIATSYAEELGAIELTELQSGPPRWVFTDSDRRLAVRVAVRTDSEPVISLQRECDLIGRLRTLGAQVMQFAGVPRESGNYTIYATEYLPGETVSSYAYGQAVASLHAAGADIEAQRLALPFQPLLRTRRAYEYLTGKNVHPSLTALGTDQTFIEMFRRHLMRGEEAAAQMLTLAAERGYDLTVTQQDTHPGNVRGDSAGEATLIDLSGLLLGPAELDFGRLRQWSQRFGLDPTQAERFMDGYRSCAIRSPDPELIELATIVSNVRYAAVSITQAVESIVHGAAPDLKRLHQSVDRIRHLDDAGYAWVPFGPLVQPGE